MNDRSAIGRLAALALGLGLWFASATTALAEEPVQRFAIGQWARPHHVVPTSDGAVWYTAQAQGAVGRLDPATAEFETFPLGKGSDPRGLFLGPDGALWITDSGLNAIVRFDPQSREHQTFALPHRRRLVNLHGAAFDGEGKLWFTGQAGVYGRLDPASGEFELSRAPRGPGPTDMTATPDGEIYFTSYNGNYLARIDQATGKAVLIPPPEQDQSLVEEAPGTAPPETVMSELGLASRTPDQTFPIPDWPVGPVGVAADSKGRIWVAEKDADGLGVYDPAAESWQEWHLPLVGAEPYSLWIDDHDTVWLSDIAAGAIWEFDQDTEQFLRRYRVGSASRIYHIQGRPGEIWAADNVGGQIVRLPTE